MAPSVCLDRCAIPQVKSPRSAMAGLSYDSQKGREAVGLGIVIALSKSDQEADAPNKKASVHHRSQPIPIAVISSLDRRPSFGTGLKNPEMAPGSAHTETECRGSIFSTASPFSSYDDDAYGYMAPTHFLTACYFCKRRLAPGRDIYMYGGDRAFCTMECRHHQIVIDEGKERCSTAVLKSGAIMQPFAKERHRITALYTTTAAAA